MLGYVKDDNPDNTTPFVDYEGKANPGNVEKNNYYKELNKLAWARRMKVKKGDLPETKLPIRYDLPGAMPVISQINVLQGVNVTNHLDFTGV